MNTTEHEELAKKLQNAIKNKNTLTTTEFKKFEPLFNSNSIPKEPVDQSTQDEYEEYNRQMGEINALALEWSNRVSIYDEVSVVDPQTKKEVVRLAPVFNRVPAINELVENGGQLMDAMSNSITKSTPLRNMSSPYIDAVCKIYDKYSKSDTSKQKTDRNSELVNSIKKPGDKKNESASKSKEALKDATWD